MSGLSGLIRFDEAGFRKDVALDVIELTKAGLMKVGRLNFVCVDTQAAPYAMLKPSEENLEGNSRFEGFSVDLLREIAKSLGFAFTLRLAKDGQHGKYDPATEKWTGMIGELLEQEADLAIGDLTITYEREQVVDFTMPWMNLGISILYRRVNRRAPNFFSFMAPLSLDVWLYIATAYLAVSLLLHWLARYAASINF
ncbi:hypothetical protein HAZT_HAZT002932 [Hyalella azteca]|uniref:Uncharacterized protein n=1 Tax=Hyalella azteca TaxID=294128 RepID=A0A6A0H0V8_HYAAZ|nr:hypothetical protein HAZT_HAZT002932 [Hyalella azteca]